MVPNDRQHKILKVAVQFHHFLVLVLHIRIIVDEWTFRSAYKQYLSLVNMLMLIIIYLYWIFHNDRPLIKTAHIFYSYLYSVLQKRETVRVTMFMFVNFSDINDVFDHTTSDTNLTNEINN